MADLPVELWHSIFNHLELIDLSSCALVCRALYSAVKAYPMQEIAFDGRVYDWFYSDFSIYQHSVDYSMASLLSRSSFNLEHLKRLKIDRCSTIYDLNRINKLVNLEDLVIDLANYKNEQSKTLSLAHLKVLRLCMSEHLPYLELDTPSLAKVYTFSPEKLDFLYPDSVRCIRTLLHVEKLSMFRNLEYLLFTTHYNQLDYSESYASQSFNEFNLTALKKLKEIEFRFNSCDFETNNWSKIQKIIRNILALERPDLKVFWYGVQVTDTYLLTDYEEMRVTSEGLTTFQLKHSKKLKDKVDYIWVYDFNESMRRLTEVGFDLKSEEFTSNFFAKYSFAGIEVTGEVKHPELLLELIAKSPGLWSLRFSGTDLDQSFFDRMANTIQMNRIPLKQLLFANHSSLNFDFVLKLCHLKVFHIDQQIPNELISKMLRLGRPTEICHRFRSGFGERIERLSTNKFLRNDEPISLQELLSECDRESDSGSDLGSGSGSDSETGSESDSETDSGSDSETDSGSDSESSESYSETDSDSDSETQCVLM